MFWRPAILDHGTMRHWAETATHNSEIRGRWHYLIPRHFQWVRLLTADNDRDNLKW
jgi:hypothetical protein